MQKEKETIRDEFLDAIREEVKYWSKQNDHTEEEKLSGLAFSILCILDGVSMRMPCSFILTPCCDDADRDECIEEGEDYYPTNSNVDAECDISGGLHELFYNK